MKLKDIKPVATLGGEPLYSAEQMQEYAKSKVGEAYQNISNYAVFAYSNNHEPIIPELQEVIDDIYKEKQDEEV